MTHARQDVHFLENGLPFGFRRALRMQPVAGHPMCPGGGGDVRGVARPAGRKGKAVRRGCELQELIPTRQLLLEGQKGRWEGRGREEGGTGLPQSGKHERDPEVVGAAPDKVAFSRPSSIGAVALPEHHRVCGLGGNHCNGR